MSLKINIPGKNNYIEVGRQWGVPVNGDYQSPFYFTGRIFKGTVDVVHESAKKP